jgi:3-hydroxy-3-methylglutaryl CoA synthase
MKASSELKVELDQQNQVLRENKLLKCSWTSGFAMDMYKFHGGEKPTQQQLDELDQRAKEHDENPLVKKYNQIHSEYNESVRREEREKMIESGRKCGWKCLGSSFSTGDELGGEWRGSEYWVPNDEYESWNGVR